MKTVTAESITLKTESGQWLAQIVITSDGAFMSISDYGNFSFAWRAFGEDFKEFLMGINVSYFGQKMYSGISYLAHSRQVEKACYLFAEKVLPPLQDYLKKQEETLRNLTTPLNNGDKVHYIPFEGCDESEYENGIVKSQSQVIGHLFVVYYCGGDWDNYRNYTAANTKRAQLRPGWHNKAKNINQ